jgi:hypothetical protein
MNENVLAVTVVSKVPFRNTLYPVMAEPPLLAGADQEIVALLSPPVTATERGDSDTVAGVAGLKVPHSPIPADVMAAIRNVYVVPFVSPRTTYDVPEASRVRVVQLVPSTEYSMRYESTEKPPLLTGAAHVSVTRPSDATADVGRTAVGTDIGVAFTTVGEAAPAALDGVMRT